LNVTNELIVNYLKVGVKNKLTNKTSKLLKHKGLQVEGDFLNDDGNLQKGFLPLTTKKNYKILDKNGESVLVKSIVLKEKQFFSKEILLIKKSDMNKDLLLSIKNNEQEQKLVTKVEKKFNKLLTDKNEIEFYKDGVTDQRVFKGEIKIYLNNEEEKINKIKKLD
jgi:hypothetical protein